MKWAEVQLGELVDDLHADVQTGPFGTQLKASDYVEDGIPVINVRNIGYSDLRLQKLEYITEHTAERLAVHVIEPEDIVFGRKGAVDRHLFVQEQQQGWVQGSDCIRLRFDTPKVNPRFVSYAFLRNSHKQWMLTQAGNKATMASLNQDVIKRIRIPLPSRAVQDNVVEILANYDDLIENNQRRIELLEESARQLYKEWFVRFRFPGHEHVKIIDGVPEGWSRKKIGDLCTVGRGASPRPIKDYLGGDVPWFKIGDATASETPFIFETAEKVIEAGARKSIWLPEGELILSNSATCGVPNFTGVPGCIHDGWLYFKDLSYVSKWHLYLYLVFQQRALLQGIGEGATQKNLNTTYVGNQDIVFPIDGKLLSVFDEQVVPLFQGVLNLAKQNNQLRYARDLLLPKLMSGEIAA